VERVLITGATGFIGGHLVKANLSRGHQVIALVRPDNPGESALRTEGVDIVTGDIRDYEIVKRAAAGVGIIFHCAAVVTDWAPKKLFKEVVVDGTENLCKAGLEAGVSRLVHVSTSDVFGIDESQVMDETFPLRPWHEPYPDSKIEAEKVCWRYHKELGLPVTMVYPCWVFGEGDRTFVPLLADAILKRELVFWRRDAIVWPTYIENLVDLLMLIAEDKRAVGNGYLVHDGEYVMLQELCAGIAKELGVPAVTTYIPYPVAYGAASVMEFIWKLVGKKTRPLLTTYTVKNLGSRLKFTIAKAERELGWKPKVSYAEGFKKTMEWLKACNLTMLKQK